MKKDFLLKTCILSLFFLFIGLQTALAHESVTVGEYELVLGWMEEPPIAGQKNGVTVRVSDLSSGEALPLQDISGMDVNIAYGGQSRALVLESIGEDFPGQFMAPLLPTIPGEYTIILSGQLGSTPVEAEVHLEEVQPADQLHFPSLESSETALERTDWLTWLALALGLVGVGLGASAHRKAR